MLFVSDLGIQMGTYSGFRDDDAVDEILALDAKLGYLARGPYLQRALDRLAPLDVEVLACMHDAPLRRAQAARLLAELRVLTSYTD